MRGQTMRAATLAALTLAGGCAGNGEAVESAGGVPAQPAQPVQTAQSALPRCEADNGGITLPTGFCALVVADSVGRARHVAVTPTGDIYIALQARGGQQQAQAPATPASRGGIVGLRDTNGDGRADERVYFGPEGGSGLYLRGNDLYFATNSAVLRYRLGGALQPTGKPDTIVHGLPAQRGHTAKSVVVSPDGAVFVNVGSATNACQERDREAGLKGTDPCTELETRAGIWRFDANRMHQTQAQGQRWATGIRNAVGMTWSSVDNSLWVTQHGRDQLNSWPPYTERDNAERPAEELQRLERAGKDFGWPYCWFDLQTQRRVLAPEYEGSSMAGVCGQKEAPVVAFPAHWAPNGLLFYSGNQFPARYRGGVFVAFHGSWNRAPLPQDGFNVAFAPISASRATGAHEIFADGFAGPGEAQGAARYRPVGLAEGPDGSLYVTDDAGGRVWRIVYTGR